MNRERAETRLLAEAELRRAAAPPGDSGPGQRHVPSLALAANVLSAVGAVDLSTARQIRGVRPCQCYGCATAAADGMPPG